MNASMLAPATTAAMHPLLARLVQQTAAAVLGPDTFDAWAGLPGAAMVVFAEDPDRSKETLALGIAETKSAPVIEASPEPIGDAPARAKGRSRGPLLVVAFLCGIGVAFLFLLLILSLTWSGVLKT